MPKKIQMKVTITGADDSVKPSHLLELSREYPFVEWGILFSEKRAGSPRYPSKHWVTRLDRLNESHENLPMRLSAHLCGAEARGGVIPAWRTDDDDGLLRTFARMQINGFSGFDKMDAWWTREQPDQIAISRIEEVILQCRAPELLAATAWDALAMGEGIGAASSVLFDASGGRGISPEAWPKKVDMRTAPARPAGAFGYGGLFGHARLGITPTSMLVCFGYAGGIGPSNVRVVVDRIREANGGELPAGTWIDMESGVRRGHEIAARRSVDDTMFYLDSVEKVLRQVDGVFTAAT